MYSYYIYIQYILSVNNAKNGFPIFGSRFLYFYNKKDNFIHAIWCSKFGDVFAELKISLKKKITSARKLDREKKEQIRRKEETKVKRGRKGKRTNYSPSRKYKKIKDQLPSICASSYQKSLMWYAKTHK